MIQDFILLTITFELITILGRLLFGSGKDFFKEYKKVLKRRIHHGYIGLALIILHLIYPLEAMLVLGLSLFVSDFLHHFVILPLWIGRTEFP